MINDAYKNKTRLDQELDEEVLGMDDSEHFMNPPVDESIEPSASELLGLSEGAFADQAKGRLSFREKNLNNKLLQQGLLNPPIANLAPSEADSSEEEVVDLANISPAAPSTSTDSSPSAPIAPPAQTNQAEDETNTVDLTKGNSSPKEEKLSYYDQLLRKSINERPEFSKDIKNPFDNERVSNLLKEYETLAGRYREPDSMMGENLHGLASTLAAASGNDSLAANQSGKQRSLRDMRMSKLDRYQKLMESMADLETKKQSSQNELETLKQKHIMQGYLSAEDIAKAEYEKNKLASLENRASEGIKSRENINDTKITALGEKLEAVTKEKEAKKNDLSEKEKGELDKMQLAELKLDESLKLYEKGNVNPGPLKSMAQSLTGGMLESEDTTLLRKNLEEDLARFIHEMSGTAAGVKEVARLKRTLPTYEDDDKQFLIKLKDALKEAKNMRELRIARYDSEGRNVPDSYRLPGETITPESIRNASNLVSPSKQFNAAQEAKIKDLEGKYPKESREAIIKALGF